MSLSFCNIHDSRFFMPEMEQISRESNLSGTCFYYTFEPQMFYYTFETRCVEVHGIDQKCSRII